MASHHGAWLAHSPRVNGARYVSTWTTDQILGPQAYESALAAFHSFIAQLNKKRWLAFSNSGIERFQFVHDDPFGGHTDPGSYEIIPMQMFWGAPEEEWSTGEFIMASTLPVYEFASTTPARECFGTDDQFMSPVIHGPGFGIRTPFAPWNFQTFCLSQEMMNELSDFPEGGSSNKLKATSPASGLKLLHHPDIVSNWKKSLKVRKKHPNAALIPCAATKPFPEAPSHRHGYLEALEGKDVDIYVVSEPLGIVPYSWSEKYPNNAYDFPPKHVKGQTRRVLVDRFEKWFEKIGKRYGKIYAALPKHHMGLVDDARGKIPIVKLSVSDCRQASCGNNVFRATSHDYIDFLKRRIR